MTNRQGVPAPAFVKRIGTIVDQRRSVEFRPLETEELVNRLKDPRFPFGWTVNPFRGCEFGCRYCYARPTHGYLGHADPTEFERRIYVKKADPLKLAHRLRRALDSGEEVAIGAVTDPYQPAEARFEVTRQVLEAIVRVPGLRVGITTKSAGIVRDVALLTEIAKRSDLIDQCLAHLDGRGPLAAHRAARPPARSPDRGHGKAGGGGSARAALRHADLAFSHGRGARASRPLRGGSPGGRPGGDLECALPARGDPWILSGVHRPRIPRSLAPLPRALWRRQRSRTPPIASASSGSPPGSPRKRASPREAGPSGWPRSARRARASYCSSGSWTGGSGALSPAAGLSPFCSMRGRNFS